MTSHDFIALADRIRHHNKTGVHPFHPAQLHAIADACRQQNSNFDRFTWLDYIAGTHDAKGKPVKKGV